VERRCRLLLYAYPASYRVQRGDEIVTTMLDAAPPGRAPRLTDQLDVVASGLRQRLGTARVPGLHAGLVRAAPVALALAAGISAFAWWRIEPVSLGAVMGGAALFGRFRTLAPIAYSAWILAMLGWTICRPAVGRVLIGAALVVTLALPLVAPLTYVDRPPLWVVMSLTAFGLLAFAGTSPGVGAMPAHTDERLAVLTGAVAIAIGASTVVLAWPPAAGRFGYYYQPTLARAGLVVTATVAALALLALRQRGRGDWLWATALLGLPAGWMGPFDSAGLLHAAPRFGRLAQVLLATCVALVCLAMLSRRRPPGVAAVGSCALGSAGGLALFAAAARVGGLGFTAGAVPTYVWCGIGALALVGVLSHGFHVAAVGWVPAAFAAALAVSCYDNAWTLGGWPTPGPTLTMVATLALPPLSACGYAAAFALRRPAQRRISTVGALVVSLGWIAYVAVPYVLSWGPVVLVLLACGLALHLASSARRDRTA
jgi:hypothetical protein